MNSRVRHVVITGCKKIINNRFGFLQKFPTEAKLQTCLYFYNDVDRMYIESINKESYGPLKNLNF